MEFNKIIERLMEPSSSDFQYGTKTEKVDILEKHKDIAYFEVIKSNPNYSKGRSVFVVAIKLYKNKEASWCYFAPTLTQRMAIDKSFCKYFDRILENNPENGGGGYEEKKEGS